MSGGDKYASELYKRFKKIDKCIITSTALRKQQYNEAGYDFEVLEITQQPPNVHQVIYYLLNAFRALFTTWSYIKKERKLNPDLKITYFSGCEYFPDIIPGYILKLFGLIDVWVISSHLIMPSAFQRYEDIYENKRHSFSILMAFNWLNQRFATFLYKISSSPKFYFGVNKEVENYLESRNIKPFPVRCGAEEVGVKAFLIEKKEYDAVFLGRFHAQKGIQFLIPIVQRVLSDIPDFKLLVIGGGDEKKEKEFKDQIEKAGLSKHIFPVGQKTGDEKMKLLAKSKIFLFPSTYESFGIVVLEAANLGLPTVAFKLPFYEDIFGDAILTADLGDVEAFGKTTVKLLQDVELQRTLAQKSKNLLKKYTWDKTFESVASVIQ